MLGTRCIELRGVAVDGERSTTAGRDSESETPFIRRFRVCASEYENSSSIIAARHRDKLRGHWHYYDAVSVPMVQKELAVRWS